MHSCILSHLSTYVPGHTHTGRVCKVIQVSEAGGSGGRRGGGCPNIHAFSTALHTHIRFTVSFLLWVFPGRARVCIPSSYPLSHNPFPFPPCHPIFHHIVPLMHITHHTHETMYLVIFYAQAQNKTKRNEKKHEKKFNDHASCREWAWTSLDIIMLARSPSG